MLGAFQTQIDKRLMICHLVDRIMLNQPYLPRLPIQCFDVAYEHFVL